ncbi:MAG: hypothetical protein ACJATP_003194 [Candidatus Azotimanducaceae bacterium]
MTTVCASVTGKLTLKFSQYRSSSLIHIAALNGHNAYSALNERRVSNGGVIVSKEKFDFDRLSAAEIDDIIHSEDVTAEQLDLLSAHTLHRNQKLKQQCEEMDDIFIRIEQRLREIKST